MKYANVIVDITHEKLDRVFQYKVPDEILEDVYPGVMVEVPFGRGNRVINAYVVEITDKAEYDIAKIKSVMRIVPESIPIESQLIKVAAWIKENYGSTMSRALKTVIPVSKKVREIKHGIIVLKCSEEEAQIAIERFSSDKRMESRVNLLRRLAVCKSLPEKEVYSDMKISKSVVAALQKAGLVDAEYSEAYRNPVDERYLQNSRERETEEIELNECQRKAVEEITGEMNKKGGKRVHLLFGVTGSGKTEVYIRCIEETLRQNRQVIMLIPEISLTLQNVIRFYARFGDRISIINSKMSRGERYDQFRRAKNGDTDVIIGPRSALFTPFARLGLIIIDEEHDGAYKSESVPKYHARETAIMRAGLSDATVILGSATPSVESYYRTGTGEYELHVMDERVNGGCLPHVEIVDLRDELKSGNKNIFSRKLLELIEDRLKRGQQSMLFVNRRGYSGFVSCRMCGSPIKCPHCSVSLTYHHYGSKEYMKCHYCGYTMNKPDKCPACGSPYLGRFGIGTESVQEKISEIFPDARVLRMDTDTTSAKDGHERILSAFSKGEADILVGTQMIVKGHDFPKVTLVGVVAADLSLYAADYRASERTFQLLTQAAGRAGRGKEAGEVIIQTYSPEEYSIVAAAAQDYEKFYKNEIAYRELMGYPPMCCIAALLLTSLEEDFVKNGAQDIAKRIKNSKIDGMTVIGPAEAAVAKINDIFRYVIYIKHRDYNEIVKVKNRIERYIETVPAYGEKLNVQFDFMPMDNY